MRCPDCNKFVSYDEPQTEVGDVSVEGTTVRANVTVQLNCQDCSNTLKDAEIESEAEITHECKPEAERDAEWKPDVEFHENEEDDQFEVDSDGDAEGTSRVQDTDRHGKPIKSARYMKTFYGYTLTTSIKCRKCGEVFDVELEGEEQASGFNECC
jgi:ribosomal protein S27E